MSLSRLQYLLDRYLDKVCTNEEYDELLLLVEDQQYSAQVKSKMDEVWAGLSREKQLGLDRADAIFNKVLASDVKVVKIPARPVFRTAVAAAVLLVMATGGYVFLKKQVETPATAATPLPAKGADDVAAGGDRATLTLADGTVIALDSASPGSISVQGSTKVIKLNSGILSYNTPAAAEKVAEIAYNVISTPKGGQYQLILPDGSRVWLNSVSSLKFPVIFSGKEREVELTGEAYFDIAENKNSPFFVKTGTARIQVLGTEFNVMAYQDEAAPKATVINGSVKVVNNGLHSAGTSTLTAGQQATWDDYSITSTKDVNIDEVIAWKNGLFQFNNTSIQTIMRQAARWYDIDVQYIGSTKELFNGSLPRSVSAATLFKVFESTGFVDFNIEGRKVIVKL